MALIDKGTHLQDDITGENFAKHSSSDKKRAPLSRKVRSGSFWDTMFGLYVEYRDHKLTMPAICKQMKVPLMSVHSHARRNDWQVKADAIIRKRNGAAEKTLTVKPADMVASNLATDQTEFRGNVSEMLTRASQTVRKMTPKAYLKQTKVVKEMVETAEKVQGWQKDEERAATAPVLNVAFLLGEGMKVVSASATEASDPHQDSPES